MLDHIILAVILGFPVVAILIGIIAPNVSDHYPESNL